MLRLDDDLSNQHRTSACLHFCAGRCCKDAVLVVDGLADRPIQRFQPRRYWRNFSHSRATAGAGGDLGDAGSGGGAGTVRPPTDRTFRISVRGTSPQNRLKRCAAARRAVPTPSPAAKAAASPRAIGQLVIAPGERQAPHRVGPSANAEAWRRPPIWPPVTARFCCWKLCRRAVALLAMLLKQIRLSSRLPHRRTRQPVAARVTTLRFLALAGAGFAGATAASSRAEATDGGPARDFHHELLCRTFPLADAPALRRDRACARHRLCRPWPFCRRWLGFFFGLGRSCSTWPSLWLGLLTRPWLRTWRWFCWQARPILPTWQALPRPRSLALWYRIPPSGFASAAGFFCLGGFALPFGFGWLRRARSCPTFGRLGGFGRADLADLAGLHVGFRFDRRRRLRRLRRRSGFFDLLDLLLSTGSALATGEAFDDFDDLRPAHRPSTTSGSSSTTTGAAFLLLDFSGCGGAGGSDFFGLRAGAAESALFRSWRWPFRWLGHGSFSARSDLGSRLAQLCRSRLVSGFFRRLFRRALAATFSALAGDLLDGAAASSLAALNLNRCCWPPAGFTAAADRPAWRRGDDFCRPWPAGMPRRPRLAARHSDARARVLTTVGPDHARKYRPAPGEASMAMARNFT